MNLYLFGGSFDPPHLGHREIINHFIKDSDLFIICPTYHSPLKESPPQASFGDRKKMLELMRYLLEIFFLKDLIGKKN